MVILNILIIGPKNSIADNIKSFLINQHNIFQLENENHFANRVSVTKSISDFRPDAVISVPFLSDVDLCQQNESLAYKINSVSSLNIAYACSTLDIPMFSISTSYVYNGDKNILYKEGDECKPINTYGKTILAAEKLIRTLCKKYFILRTSWVFGGPDCLVKKVIENRDIPLFMCSKEFGNPTYIKDICLTIKSLLNSRHYGVYNCASNNPVPKCTWIKEILRFSGIEKEVYEVPDSFFENMAPRPKFASIDTSLLEETTKMQFADWRISLLEYISTLN